jgi:hypothetical protein
MNNMNSKSNYLLQTHTNINVLLFKTKTKVLLELLQGGSKSMRCWKLFQFFSKLINQTRI